MCQTYKKKKKKTLQVKRRGKKMVDSLNILEACSGLKEYTEGLSSL
jgi:hypothetical protein